MKVQLVEYEGGDHEIPEGWDLHSVTQRQTSAGSTYPFLVLVSIDDKVQVAEPPERRKRLELLEYMVSVGCQLTPAGYAELKALREEHA